MAKSNLPVFAQTPRTQDPVAVAAVGNLNTDAPTNLVDLYTVGADGAITNNISAIPRGPITAPIVLYLFRQKNGTGAIRLRSSVVMPVNTVTGIVEVPFPRWSELRPLRSEAGDKYLVGLGTAYPAGIVFSHESSDFTVAT